MIKVEGVSWRLGVNMSEQDNTYRPVYQRYYIRKSTSPKVRPKRHPHPYIVNIRTEHRGHSCRPGIGSPFLHARILVWSFNVLDVVPPSMCCDKNNMFR